MNLPNLITLARLGLTGVCFICLEMTPSGNPDATLVWWAFALFLVAAVTDFFDGYLARRFGQVTPFGRVFDPLADKILVCGALVILCRFEAATTIMPTWFVVVVVVRELLVTTVRGFAEANGMAFPAERLGKWKMVAQCVTAAALLTLVAGSQRFYTVAVISLWVSLVLTVASAGQYLWRARSVLMPR